MTDKQIELAARKLCELLDQNPDTALNRPPTRIGERIITQWQIYADEIRFQQRLQWTIAWAKEQP